MTRRGTTWGVLAAAVLWTTVAAQSLSPPFRVFSDRRNQFADLDALLADLDTADVLFVGEQHTDPNTHLVERVLLEGLASRHRDVVLSLEMFDRDVQEPLAHFLMGHLTEEEFLKDARPWPRYDTDYKPLVDLAIANTWPVVAANVPRAIAADVSRAGLQVLANRPEAERGWFARDPGCPLTGANYDRFKRAMTGAAASDALSAASVDRYYLAQCLKDETMAESIAQAHAAGRIVGRRPLVVSINGAFHTDRRGGLVEGVTRRMAGARTLLVTIQPVTRLDAVAPNANERQRADYLIYTVGEQTPDLQDAAVPAGAHAR